MQQTFLTTDNILLSNKTLYEIFESVIIGRNQVEYIHNLLLKHNKYPSEIFCIVETNNADSISDVLGNISKVSNINKDLFQFESEAFNIIVVSLVEDLDEIGKKIINTQTLGLFEWLVHLSIVPGNNVNINEILTSPDWNLYYIDKKLLQFESKNLSELYEDNNFKEIMNVENIESAQ